MRRRTDEPGGAGAEAKVQELVSHWSSVERPSAADASAAVAQLTESANLLRQEAGEHTPLVLEARQLALQIAAAAFGAAAVEASYPRRNLAQALQELGQVARADALLAEDLRHVEARGDRAEVAGALYALAQLRIHSAARELPVEALLDHIDGLVASDESIRQRFELLLAELRVALAADAEEPPRRIRSQRAVVDAVRRAVGPSHVDYALALNELGRLYTELGLHDEAEHTLMLARGKLGEGETQGFVLLSLVELNDARGNPAAALELLELLEQRWRWKHDAPRHELRALRSRLEAAAGERPPATERLRHPKLGEGEVLSREGGKVRLRMSDGSERTFLATALELVDG